MPKLTHIELLEMLNYEPSTGIFIWLKSTARRIKIGDIAGCLQFEGYWTIEIKRERFYAHVLAWFYVHGYWPTNLIDHNDRDKLNNRISNLRECNYSLNSGNSSIHKDNFCRFKGVSRMRSKFRARIQNKALGVYATEQEAAKAYDIAAVRQFGQFALTNQSLGLLP